MRRVLIAGNILIDVALIVDAVLDSEQWQVEHENKSSEQFIVDYMFPISCLLLAILICISGISIVRAMSTLQLQAAPVTLRFQKATAVLAYVLSLILFLIYVV
jgi:uncharacterized membrane protein